MRKRRIGTVSFLIDNKTHTISENVEKSLRYIQAASEDKVDVLCFPEALLTQNTKEIKKARNNVFPVETFPGKYTRIFCEQARQYKMNLVIPNYVKSKNEIYNQATVINSKGIIAGFYRKIQPTFTEKKSISFGNDLSIIEVDGIKIGIMICLDIYFPEIVRIYAYKGADIVFWPTLTHGPIQAGLENQLKSRAIDNSIYIVQSNIACSPPYAPYSGKYQPGRSNITDPNGEIIADTGRKHGLCFADIDFDEEKLTSGVLGISEPDRIKEDLQSITRLDLFTKEYKKLNEKQKKNKFYFKK